MTAKYRSETKHIAADVQGGVARAYPLLKVLIMLFLFLAHNVEAKESITPSDVYKKTEELRVTLEQLGYIDMQPPYPREEDRNLRHPRHVMHKLRECSQIIAKKQAQKGVTEVVLPPLTSYKEIKPADVLQNVEDLITAIQKEPPPPRTTVEQNFKNKVPTDVYNNLNKICHAINVDIEAPDLLRVAKVIRHNIYKIAQKDEPLDRDEATAKKGTSLLDIHYTLLAFADTLRTLALNPDYAIPGGVILYSEAQKAPAPDDTLTILYDMVAETNAIKYSIHASESIDVPKPDETATYEDVHTAISEAHDVLQEFLLDRNLAVLPSSKMNK